MNTGLKFEALSSSFQQQTESITKTSLIVLRMWLVLIAT
jgi:hypothetical protein